MKTLFGWLSIRHPQKEKRNQRVIVYLQRLPEIASTVCACEKRFFQYYPVKFLNLILCLHILGGPSAIAQNSYELGEAALQHGNYKEAVQYFIKAEKNGKTLARLGYAYSQLGRYGNATRAYQDALRFAGEPRSLETQVAMSQALLGLGYITYQQGRFDDAVRLYKEVIQQDKAGVAEAHHNLGRIYAGRGEIEKAIAVQQQAIAEAPDFADAHYHLGVLYSRGRDWHAAINAYEKTVELTPTMPNVYYQLARCYRQTTDIQNAEKAMQRFRALKAADVEIQKHLEAVFVADIDEKAEALLKLARTYLKHERYEEAIHEFTRVRIHSTSDTHIAKMSAGLGSIAVEQGNITEAIAYYESALQHGLETAEIYHNLGIAYMQNRDGKNALEQFHRALDINANLPETSMMLGTLYAANKNFEAAETHYQRAIALAPEGAIAYHGLAYLYGQHDQNLEEAIELVRHATALSPNSARYYNTLSWLCYKVGRYQEAEIAILKAIALAPDNPLYRDGLTEIRQHGK